MNSRIDHERKTIQTMIVIFCREHHADRVKPLVFPASAQADYEVPRSEKVKILEFPAIYSRRRFSEIEEFDMEGGHPCDDCLGLYAYAMKRIDACPFVGEFGPEAKPICEKCPVHCYRPAMRERITQVIDWSAPRMVFRHPFLLFRHRLQGLRRISKLPSNYGRDE